MPIAFHIQTILTAALSIPVIIGLIAKRRDQPANILLVFVMIFSILAQAATLAEIQGFPGWTRYLFQLDIVCYACNGPLIYFYFFRISHDDAEITSTSVRANCMLPMLSIIWYYLGLKYFSGDNFSTSPSNRSQIYDSYLGITLVTIVRSGYLIASYRSVRSYQKVLKQYYADTARVRLNWLKLLLVISTVLVGIDALDIVSGPYLRFGVERSIVSAIAALLLATFAVSQSSVFAAVPPPLPQGEKIAKPDLRRTTLSDSQLESAKLRLNDYLTTQQPFLDPNLRMPDLAKMLDLTPHQLSYVINTALQTNFYELINRSRVDEFKRRSLDQKFGHLNLLGIAMDCGFNSKSAFNAVFKEYTGLTPSQFRATQAR